VLGECVVGIDAVTGERGPGAGASGVPDAPLLRRMQLIELEILQELARRCESASLRWFVIGGTLLGAARHGGFIPWDDDIDVGMPRPDYERFDVLCRRSPDTRFAWQSSGTDPAYPFLYGKLLLVGTRVEEAPLAGLPIRLGVSIDVFPLDGAPGSGPGRWVHALAYKAAATALGARIRRAGIRRYVAYPMRALPRSWAIGLVGLLARRFTYDGSTYVVNAGGAWGYGRECQPRRRLEPPATLEFEGMRVPVPGRWHEYLAQIYGDYMRLPPPDERHPRHEVTVLSLGSQAGPAESAPRPPDGP
jgi:lipopolysaccharide cholinephosphotransferase